MATFTLRPHTFTVQRNTGAYNVPPTTVLTTILSGVCNNQTSTSGGIGNENEALEYDYVMFHDETITTELKAEDSITVNHAGKTITGTVKKALTGQLSSRIWYNEISQ